MNYQLKKYPKYKPSGIEWIGEIPEHWSITTIGRLNNLGRGRVISNIEIGENPGTYPVYSSQTENNGIMGYLNTYDFEGQYVTWTTDGANAGTVFYREGKFNCTNVCGTIQPKNWDLIDLKYLPYYLNLGTRFSVRLDINPKLMNNMMAKIPLILPPKAEQTAIAKYLDDKTAKIDSLIEKKKKLIELYKEERTAVINHYVLGQHLLSIDNGQLTMDNSQLSIYNYQLPKGWQVKKLKYVAKVNSESLTEKEDKNLLIHYIDISSVDSDGKIISTTEYLYSDAPSRARRKINVGDTILSTVRTYLKAIAYIGEVNNNLICSTGFAVIRPLDVFNPKYLFYIFRSQIIIEKIIAASKGVSYPAIDSEDIKYISVWYPDKNEQHQIVQHIEAETKRIDSKIARTEKEIELLQEYRTALISEVVTGKIKVIDD